MMLRAFRPFAGRRRRRVAFGLEVRQIERWWGANQMALSSTSDLPFLLVTAKLCVSCRDTGLGSSVLVQGPGICRRRNEARNKKEWRRVSCLFARRSTQQESPKASVVPRRQGGIYAFCSPDETGGVVAALRRPTMRIKRAGCL